MGVQASSTLCLNSLCVTSGPTLYDWTALSSTPPLLSCLARLPCYRTQCSWLPLPSAPYLVHLAGQVCQHKPHAALCSWPALSNNGCLCSTPAQCSRPMLTHCGCAKLQVCAVHVILGAPASLVQHEDVRYQAQIVLCSIQVCVAHNLLCAACMHCLHCVQTGHLALQQACSM